MTDRFGNPVAGQPLQWTVASGGGTVSGSAATDAGGFGWGTWTLGPVVGSPQTARVFAGTSLSTDFTATATLPAGTAVTRAAGNAQAGTVGQPLLDSLAVAVTLPDGRPAAGVEVRWQASPGAGSVSPAVAHTGADGRAATRWTLGPAATVQSVTALVAGSPGVDFLATARAGAPATMVAVAGGGQTAPPGQPLPAPLVVELRDAAGNAVPGAEVQWTVDSAVDRCCRPPASPMRRAARKRAGRSAPPARRGACAPAAPAWTR